MKPIEKTYARINRESSEALMKRDIATATQHMDEEFVFYRATETGPEAAVQGPDEARQVLKAMLVDSDAWLGAETEHLGAVDNIIVQVEKDTFKTEDGTTTMTSLAVLEFRNGKRWREWKFYPAEK